MNERDAAVVRRATHWLRMGHRLSQDLDVSDEQSRPPMHWPSMSSDDIEDEQAELGRWVAQLNVRFPHIVTLPPCWQQHNDLIELLAALRDAERGCYGPTARPTAAVEWHRHLREVELRLEMWIKRLPCGITQRGHVE